MQPGGFTGAESLPQVRQDVKGKDTALAYAVPQGIYTSTMVLVNLCTP